MKKFTAESYLFKIKKKKIKKRKIKKRKIKKKRGKKGGKGGRKMNK